MDENKRKVLNEIGYRVGSCCGLCQHARPFNREGFSTCTIHGYSHLKHSPKRGEGIGEIQKESRELSITQYGLCPDFSAAAEVPVKLHGYVEFLH